VLGDSLEIISVYLDDIVIIIKHRVNLNIIIKKVEKENG
jgi:hypothetical protein